jgi:hypothetical protein
MSDSTVDTISQDSPPVKPGMYLATVTSVLDNTFMGTLQVKLKYPGSANSEYKGQQIPVKYMSPFLGSTSKDYVKDTNTYGDTQKSYGMWMVPPDVGTTVIVIFMQGSPKWGYWIGCVPDDSINFMTPGIAATKFAIDGVEERVPVAEYNRISNPNPGDPTKAKKPQHPLAEVLQSQGLLKDDTRGITTSSARRESPSTVFGISTPGPVDKDGPQGLVGTLDTQVTCPISRLGGSTFVMDDGDDKFLRKTPASEGPPDYSSVEEDETDGDPTIPHNELVRIRTRTGHQILLHNSEDLIYIGNARGTTWIELTSNGKVDIYAEDSISVHTKHDLNFRADRDINFEAGRNFNMAALGKMHLETALSTEIVSGVDTLITSVASSHINSGVSHLETAGKIHMNSESAPASMAEILKQYKLPDETGAVTISSIMLRVPTQEPWPHHENLAPQIVTPDLTDAAQGNDIPVPPNYNKYSIRDTFEKLKRAEN